MPALSRFLVLLTLCLGLGQAPASAQNADSVPAADAAAIQAVIQAQLDAFRVDDWVRAYSYATPAIQTRFVSPEIFSQMVRSGYQPVYRPKGVEFREVQASEFGPMQELFVIGPDDRSYLAYYTMERQADGTWLISGCYLVRGQDQSV